MAGKRPVIGFGQSGFTVVAPLKPGRETALRTLLEGLGKDPAGNATLPFGGVPRLHFAALALFQIGANWRLLFEGNVDGDPAAFLGELAECRAEGLGAVLEHCAGSEGVPPAEYLRGHDAGYGSFYVGCPGRTVQQIESEARLYSGLQDALGPEGKGHDRLGLRRLVQGRPDLAFALEPYVRPWLVRRGPGAVKAGTLVLGAALAGLLAWGLLRAPWTTLGGVLGLALAAALAWAYLRHLESTDVPFPNLRYRDDLRDVLDREDFGIGNHLTSVTTIKPGPFRALLLRGVLLFVGFAARFLENRGQLAGIPSIHFARWVIVEGRTLVFLSNFDGSWESYLNDFIDKGAGGLTAVWSNTVGFPQASGLTGEGARSEREFKVFARNSQIPTLVWYRAYPDLTTSNVENDTRVREGLLPGSLPEKEEERWTKRL